MLLVWRYGSTGGIRWRECVGRRERWEILDGCDGNFDGADSIGGEIVEANAEVVIAFEGTLTS